MPNGFGVKAIGVVRGTGVVFIVLYGMPNLDCVVEIIGGVGCINVVDGGNCVVGISIAIMNGDGGVGGSVVRGGGPKVGKSS